MKAVAALSLALTLSTLSQQGHAQRAAPIVISDDARRLFKEGTKWLEHPTGPRHQQAYAAFKKAYASSPSPKILGNLGYSAMALERDDEARRAYDRYLAEVNDISTTERTRITRDLEALRKRASQLDLDLAPAGVTIIDERVTTSGKTVRNRYVVQGRTLRLTVRAGQHLLEFSATGHQSHRWRVRLAPRDRLVRHLKLQPSSSPPQPKSQPPASARPLDEKPPQQPPEAAPTTEASQGLSTPTIALLAASGTLLGGGIVLGAFSVANKGDYSDLEHGGPRAQAEAIRDRGNALNVATDIVLGAALASGAGALILFLTTDNTPADRAESAKSRVRIRAAEAPIGLGLALHF